MKRLTAAFLLVAPSIALAQAPGVPEQNCLPKPTYPGIQALKSEVEVKTFEGQIKAYKECIMQYISDRKSASKANDSAASAAADEHNKVMDKIRKDQEAARADSEKAATSKEPGALRKAP